MSDNQLSLFVSSNGLENIPSIFSVSSGTNKSTGALNSLTLKMNKRSEIAKDLKLVGKTNKVALDLAIRKMTDQLKKSAVHEVVTIGQSEDWTAHSIKRSRGKAGDTYMVKFFRPNEASPVPIDDAIKAMASAGLSDQEILAKLKEFRDAKAAPVDVQVIPPAAAIADAPVIDNSTAELKLDEASAAEEERISKMVDDGATDEEILASK